MEYCILNTSGEKIEITWEQVVGIEKDICYLLHQVVDDYDSLGGGWDWDWYTEMLFPLKYWNFLGLQGDITTFQQDFINHGCLLWILGLSMEQLEDNGRRIDLYGSEIAERLAIFHPKRECTTRLLRITQYFFQIAQSLPARTGIGRPRDKARVMIDPQMQRELDWVFVTVVEGYYRYMLELIADNKTLARRRTENKNKCITEEKIRVRQGEDAHEPNTR